VRDLPADLFNAVPRAVTIIDTSHYYPDMRDSRTSEIDGGMTESVWASKLVRRPVIKAFNNALAFTLAKLGRRQGPLGRIAIPVAGMASILSLRFPWSNPGGSSRQHVHIAVTMMRTPCTVRSPQP